MDLFDIRRDFSLKTLDEHDALPNPFDMLQLWINNAIESKALEPNAITVSTVSAEGRPSSRVVLLKELKPEGLVFFTNYDSRKGQQIAVNPYVALNFVWHELERQVRVEGVARRLSEEESSRYYAMRPRDTRIGAWASPQSQPISDRHYLDERVKEYADKFADGEIPKPPHWGGYIVEPYLFEFWQGRKNRLHDRIEYLKDRDSWKRERLAP